MTNPAPLESIFFAALEKHSPEERMAFLDEACAENDELRGSVERMLAAQVKVGSFLEIPASGLGAAPGDTEVYPRMSEGPGAVIGPYKLLQQIGEGGFGVVFMAEQTEPIQRTVALKIIKPGMDTRQVIARFEAERQALAMMDHPNIARVLDVGATEAGRPYFVMDLVKGVPITDYCDQQHLPVRQRLELFAHVCQAVQHAHQKGIIHRDLKPTNVLVAEYDGIPVPKVIDFGVAKATAQKLTEKTMFTELGQMVGTVEYMSPEQARFNQLDVDTRSDIYSLGVLLYELLTGSTPFGRKQLNEAAFDEMLRIIREEEPPKPSTRLSTTEGLPSIAANRGLEPLKLNRLVRGELDWIVMKSLEKDRNRRYDSANDFAADIARYLNDQTVEACPPSTWYRFRKLARRYKMQLAAAALFAAVLVAASVFSTWQAVSATRANAAALIEKRRADQEAATAKKTTESLQQMLGLVDPDAAISPDYTVLQLIDDFADHLDEKLAEQPAAAADLHSTLGRSYACRGQRDKAKKHLKRALELGRSIYGDQNEKYADILVDYARPDAWDPPERPALEAELRQALAIYRARDVGNERVIRALWTLQWNLFDQAICGVPDKWEEIEPVLHEALAEAAKSPEVEFREIPSIQHALASLEIHRSHYVEAETIAQGALALHLKLHPGSLETAWGYFTLGEALRPQGKFAQALAAENQALTMIRKALPPGHNSIEYAVSALISTLEGADRSHALADLFPSVADLGEWETVFSQVAETTKPGKLDKDDPLLAAVIGLARCSEFYVHLGQEWREAGKIGLAEQSHQKAILLLESLQNRFANVPELLPYVYRYGVIAMMKAGDIERARELSRKLMEQSTPTSSSLQNDVAWFLATAEIPAHRDPTLAIELGKKAVASDPKSSAFRNTLGVALYRAGNWKQSVSELEKSVALGDGGNGSGFFFLAMAQWQLGDHDRARMRNDQAVEWTDKWQPNEEQLHRFRGEAALLLGVNEKQD